MGERDAGVRADGTVPSGIVTFLFTDVEGSTRLWAADSDVMSASLLVHDGVLRRTFESRGGFVFTTADDSFAVAFSRASDAVAAAQAAQEMLFEQSWLHCCIQCNPDALRSARMTLTPR